MDPIFVGMTSRSRNGCLGCRRKKKKCDEVHPICGLCRRTGTQCCWKPAKKRGSFDFDSKTLVRSQQMLRDQLVKQADEKRLRRLARQKTLQQSTRQGKNDRKSKRAFGQLHCSPIAPLSAVRSRVAEVAPVGHDALDAPDVPDAPDAPDVPDAPDAPDVHEAPDAPDGPDGPDGVVPTDSVKSSDVIEGIDPASEKDDDDDDDDKDDAIVEVVDDGPASAPSYDGDLDNFMSNFLTVVRSPAFAASPGAFDTLSGISMLSPLYKWAGVTTPDSSKHLTSEDNGTASTTPEEIVDSSVLAVAEEADVEDDSSDMEFAPMDESQMLEMQKASDKEIILMLKQKSIVPYLNPTFRALFGTSDKLNIIRPSSNVYVDLDDTGRLFLDHYLHYMALNTLCNGNEKYYYNYCLAMAEKSRPILYTLVAWGGLFLLGNGSNQGQTYYRKALDMTEGQLNQLTRSGLSEVSLDDTVAVTLAFVLLSACNVSVGDVNEWYPLMQRAWETLKQAAGGDMLKLIQMRNKSPGLRWIFSWLLYHDAVSTSSLDAGPLISASSYRLIEESDKSCSIESDILDPMLGISRNLYTIMVESLEVRHQIASERFESKLLNRGARSTTVLNAADREYEARRFNAFQELEEKLVAAQPSKVAIERMGRINYDMLENHLCQFELLQYTLRLWLRLSMLELKFSDPEVQELKTRGDQLFDMLVETPVRCMLCFSMLMLSIPSITPEQRTTALERMKLHSATYPCKTVTRCCEVIHIVWEKYDRMVELNDNTDPSHVDWTEVFSELGWTYSFA